MAVGILHCGVRHPTDIEPIRMSPVNEACERMLQSDVKYRFVIDMATVKDAAAA